MKLSIVIVNYKVPYFLQLCLQSVARAIVVVEDRYGAGSVETYMVDNASEDNSVALVQEQFPWVHTIANVDNVGFSKANNQAMRMAKGEYILLLNPDTVVQEHTLLESIATMDRLPNAGALGIQMLTGRGEYLPESKRGFPSPMTSFFKISGLYRLRPKSAYFNAYYMGHLSKDSLQEVEVLAGAYMMLRKEALDKVGLLDEDFFMYGEDIDLSYRIRKGGYANLYQAKEAIVHFKGESTKKTSVNYVRVFYKAMAIFARKHFSAKSAKWNALLLYFAIWFKAGMTIARQLFTAILVPLLDFWAGLAAMAVATMYWERTIKYVHGGGYPPVLYEVGLPMVALLHILGLYLSGGYQKPYVFRRIPIGFGIGIALVVFIYAFLDEQYRFSRALIGVTALAMALSSILIRLFANFYLYRSFSMSSKGPKRIIFIGDEAHYQKFKEILSQVPKSFLLMGYLSPNHKTSTGTTIECLGSSTELSKACDLYKPDELVYSCADYSYSFIIQSIHDIGNRLRNIHFKFLPAESSYIIGSSSKHEPGDYYIMNEAFALSDSSLRFQKRIVDCSVAIIWIVLAPLLILLGMNALQLVQNALAVLRNEATWVGYASEASQLPKLPKGIITPSSHIEDIYVTEALQQRFDYFYAKNYSPWIDVQQVLRKLRSLDSKW